MEEVSAAWGTVGGHYNEQSTEQCCIGLMRLSFACPTPWLIPPARSASGESLTDQKWLTCASLYRNCQYSCVHHSIPIVHLVLSTVYQYVSLCDSIIYGESFYKNCQSMKSLWCASIYMNCMTHIGRMTHLAGVIGCVIQLTSTLDTNSGRHNLIHKCLLHPHFAQTEVIHSRYNIYHSMLFILHMLLIHTYSKMTLWFELLHSLVLWFW